MCTLFHITPGFLHEQVDARTRARLYQKVNLDAMSDVGTIAPW